MGAQEPAGGDNNGVRGTSANTGQPCSILCAQRSEVSYKRGRQGGRERKEGRTFELSLSEEGGEKLLLAEERTSSKGPWLTRGWCVLKQKEGCCG